MANWKQPIPTNITDFTSGHKLDATVFMIILLRCSNADGTIYLQDNTPISVKRGQCVTGRFELSQYFGMKKNQASKIYRSLDRLQKKHKLIDKQKSKNCTLITVKNYDQIISFEQTPEQSEKELGEILSQSSNTNKSIKNNKSIDTYKKVIIKNDKSNLSKINS